MGNDALNTEIRGFLEKYIPDADFKNDDDIFELGLVNSLMAMQLVLFLEKQYGLHLVGKDLDFTHFRTVTRIAALIAKKLEEKGAGA